MQITVKKSDDKEMVIKQIRERLNGESPNELRYTAEPIGDDILINIKL